MYSLTNKYQVNTCNHSPRYCQLLRSLRVLSNHNLCRSNHYLDFGGIQFFFSPYNFASCIDVHFLNFLFERILDF